MDRKVFDALDDAVTAYRARIADDMDTRKLFDAVMHEHGFNYVPDPTTWDEDDLRPLPATDTPKD